MKTLVKIFIVLVLVLAIFGGAAWYAYDLYLKPKKVSRPKSIPGALSAKDTSDKEYESLLADRKSKPLNETIAVLQNFISNHASSSKIEEAKTLLGSLNVEEFFSPSPGPGKVEYIVVPGDSLSRIATKNKASFDLIIRANNIDRLLIHPGDKFIIPSGTFVMEISAKAKSITLKKDGVFFKEYRALSSALPANPNPAGMAISEKIAWYDGKRIAFGDKNYVGSSRWISLVGSGVTIFSQVEDGSVQDVAPPTSGVRLEPGDLEEIFALVNPGTSVTIVP